MEGIGSMNPTPGSWKNNCKWQQQCRPGVLNCISVLKAAFPPLYLSVYVAGTIFKPEMYYIFPNLKLQVRYTLEPQVTGNPELQPLYQFRTMDTIFCPK